MLSIIIITKNEEQHIQKTINSCLATNASEIIVVDSNSSDKTQAIVGFNIEKNNKIKLITYDTPPFTAARGRHIGACSVDKTTKYILFLDGDMEIIPEFLPIGIAELTSDKKLAAIMGQMSNHYYKNSDSPSKIVDNIYNLKKHIIGGAMLIKRDIYDAAGGYNISLIVNEESELEHRLNLLGYYTKRINNKMVNHHTEAPRSFEQIRSRLLDKRITALGINLHLGIKKPSYMLHLIKTNPQIFATLLVIILFPLSIITKNITLVTVLLASHALYIRITSGKFSHIANYIIYAIGMMIGFTAQLAKTENKNTSFPSKKK